MGIAIDN